MQRYLMFRFGQSIIALIGVSMLVFFLTRLSGNVLDLMLPIEATPEDFERVEKAWGLDKPIVVQYGLYMKNVLRGDWGESWKWGSGALEIVLEKFPATVQLASFTLIVSTTLGLTIGMLVATKKDTPFDWGGKIVALLGQSLPSFWLGIVLMWVFAVLLGWLPTSGRGGIRHMIMPAITLGWFNVAALMRLTRSSMLEVMDSEYVKLARIKGSTRVESHLEALPSERCHCALDLFWTGGRFPAYGLGGDGNSICMAWDRTFGSGGRSGERLSGGTSRSVVYGRYLHLSQPSRRRSVRIPGPPNSI